MSDRYCRHLHLLTRVLPPPCEKMAESLHRAAQPDPELHRANQLLALSASELYFIDVRAQQLYTKSLQVTNPLSAPVDVVVRVGNPERYRVEPAQFTLASMATTSVDISLKLQSIPPPRRAGGGTTRGC